MRSTSRRPVAGRDVQTSRSLGTPRLRVYKRTLDTSKRFANRGTDARSEDLERICFRRHQAQLDQQAICVTRVRCLEGARTAAVANTLLPA